MFPSDAETPSGVKVNRAAYDVMERLVGVRERYSGILNISGV